MLKIVPSMETWNTASILKGGGESDQTLHSIAAMRSVTLSITHTAQSNKRAGQRTRGATPLAAHRLEPSTCNAAVPAYDIVTGRSPANPITPRCSHPALVSYYPYKPLRGRTSSLQHNNNSLSDECTVSKS